MPFTPSHAVVALPFVRSPLVPAAIAVGAMTPDLPLFVRGVPLHAVGLSYGRTHDLLWLPTTIVFAALLLLLWRCLLRPAVRELAPRWLAARLPGEWDRGALPALRETLFIDADPARERPSRPRVRWRGMLLLLLSLALGVISHIVWDLFTHEGRWGVTLLPVLDEQWGPLTGFKWLQHGSSAVGLAVIAVWMLVWLSRRRAAASVDRVLPGWVRWCWWVSLPVVLMVAWMLGLAVLGPLDADFTAAHLAYRVLPPACAVWGVATVVLAVVAQVVRRKAATPQAAV
jgi:hypothetical protein